VFNRSSDELHSDLIKKSEEDNRLFLQQLENLINQTYVIESEYKNLNSSYKQLQNTIEQIVDFLPNPLWIVEDSGEIFLQNSKAKELRGLLEELDLNLEYSEVEYGGASYLVKINRYKDKRLVNATDNTEFKRRERLITMGQMAAHLSHEIRNPTASISLISSTLLKRVGVMEKPLVFEIQKSVFRIERIIKATLLYSKGIVVKRDRVELNQIQSDLEDAIGYYSYTKPIDFIFNWDSIEISCDRELLVIMFSNFIFNAIDAIEADENDSGEIRLEYKGGEGDHIFHIYDSGIPIENEAILFEAFKSTKEKGNGLGLVLSQQIAHQHGGYIKLIDEVELDKGFEISIGL
jgi:two-component system NtrC family sensor kinase/two-component system sensor histidine kinase AtoS